MCGKILDTFSKSIRWTSGPGGILPVQIIKVGVNPYIHTQSVLTLPGPEIYADPSLRIHIILLIVLLLPVDNTLPLLL